LEALYNPADNVIRGNETRDRFSDYSKKGIMGRLGRRSSNSGQAVIYMALLLPVMLGMVGIAVDVGFLECLKRLAQSAADAGAIAGAQEIPYIPTANDVTASARAATASNHYTNGTGGVTVAVNNPPSFGVHAGNASYVEVIVSQTHSTFFLNMVGIGSGSIASRAVAYSGGVSTAPNCLYTLGTTGPSLSVTGSDTVTASGCGVTLDSSSSSALSVVGSATVTAHSIGIVGGSSVVGSATVTPTPVTGIVPANDPLAYLPAPTVASCAGTPLSIVGSGTANVNPGGFCYNVSVTGSSTVTFNPGEYSAINLTGSPSVTFNPGLYIFANGSLSLTGSGTVTGSGVTFYLGPNAGSVTYTGSGGSTLSAPTTGTYAGILFFQDRSDANTATFTGSSSASMQGVLYFPDAGMTWTGSGATVAYLTVVAQSLTLTGSASLTLTANFAGLANGSPIKNAVLVE
jgi:hypothetical protein